MLGLCLGPLSLDVCKAWLDKASAGLGVVLAMVTLGVGH